jgi:hypothetical protein
MERLENAASMIRYIKRVNARSVALGSELTEREFKSPPPGVDPLLLLDAA